LKDPRAGFKQKRYMERYLQIGKQTGIHNFMDRLDILSTYLPLFPPGRSEVMSELLEIQKREILYDAVPHYYIKKMKEANTAPIKMLLEALFQFALNIEESAVNPGKDSEGNARSSKYLKNETTVPQNQGGGKGKNNDKKSGGKSSILKGQ
jgi:hypothetical protein